MINIDILIVFLDAGILRNIDKSTQSLQRLLVKKATIEWVVIKKRATEWAESALLSVSKLRLTDHG